MTETLQITFDTRPQFRRFFTRYKKDKELMTFYDGHDGKTLNLRFPNAEICDKVTKILELKLKELGIK